MRAFTQRLVLAVLQQESLLCPVCETMEREDTYLQSYLSIQEPVLLPAFPSEEKALINYYILGL